MADNLMALIGELAAARQIAFDRATDTAPAKLSEIGTGNGEVLASTFELLRPVDGYNPADGFAVLYADMICDACHGLAARSRADVVGHLGEAPSDQDVPVVIETVARGLGMFLREHLQAIHGCELDGVPAGRLHKLAGELFDALKDQTNQIVSLEDPTSC